MSWCKAVWKEDDQQYCKTVPSSWVDKENKMARWPVKVNAARAMIEGRIPEEN